MFMMPVGTKVDARTPRWRYYKENAPGLLYTIKKTIGDTLLVPNRNLLMFRLWWTDVVLNGRNGHEI